MSAYVVEWLSLLGRWVHFVTGVAWIGASFYFIWLDNHLQAPRNTGDRDKGVGGEVWAVHGGGFYHAQKYRVSPAQLPETLHWFKWEAYSTWLSGMFLLVLIYWYGAEIYLIDSARFAFSRTAAIAAGAGVIVAGWLGYDLLCKSPLGRNDRALSLVIGLLAAFVAWGLCQVFSGRGAFIHFGAMLGTIMVANVYFVIIPSQKQLVAVTAAGAEPDAEPGRRARQRSVHNTYFTLPVLFVMISNHYAMTFSHEWNWLILIAIALAGALIRVWFVARHRGKASLLPLGLAALLLIGVAVAIAPRPVTAQPGATVTMNEVQRIVTLRCVSCHAAEPSHAAFTAPPAGVILETPAQIEAEAERIYQQTVLTRAMPLGNLTAITEQERAAIGQWHAGAGVTMPDTSQGQTR